MILKKDKVFKTVTEFNWDQELWKFEDQFVIKLFKNIKMKILWTFINSRRDSKVVIEDSRWCVNNYEQFVL